MAIQPEKMMELYNMLPEKDQEFAYEFVKKLVLAWDPDFIKLTDAERKALESAKNDEYVDAEEINWDDLGA